MWLARIRGAVTLAAHDAAVVVRSHRAAPIAAIGLIAISERLQSPRSEEIVALLKAEAMTIESMLVMRKGSARYDDGNPDRDGDNRLLPGSAIDG